MIFENNPSQPCGAKIEMTKRKMERKAVSEHIRQSI
jgi:hypothetical protein